MEQQNPAHPVEIEEQHPHGGEWLREVVFGLNDGLVTTLVFIMVVSGVAHASLVLIALGEVIAGGISMALGAYLSAHTTRDVIHQRIATEHHEIHHEAEEERAELRDIYHRKGLSGELLDQVVDHLTADNDRWLQAMVTDELGLVEGVQVQPWLDGVLVGGSFVVGGLVPVLPFLTSLPSPQFLAYGLAAVTALVFGALKARYTLKGPIRSGLEFLAIVTVGTLAGVGAGALLHGI